MANLSAFDASKLAERLQELGKEEFWLHLEAASMLEKYPAKQHARRVRDKLDVPKGLIYLPGSPAWNNEDSDMPAPFRQRRYFYYLSGCNEPDCHLTYDIQHDRLALFIPRINPERVIWNGRGSTPAEALDKYDIDEVYFTDELPAWIQTWSVHYQGRLYILHDYQIPTPYFGGEIDSSSLQPAVNLARMIKDEHEIKLIRKANNISSEAHKQVLANVLKFKNEAQVEGLFLDVCISNQAKQQAYDPIAASGPNAGTLHYDANNEDFGDRQLMCLDAGCEYELYASDITRTFPLSGSWPSIESENIYRLVQRMQEACIKKLAPGVRYLDLHILAHHIAIDGLLRLGLLHNGTVEEIYKAGTSRAFFPHGLGHHVGLEVHDVGQKELMSLYERNPKYEKAPSLYPEDFHLPVYDEKLCLAPTDPQSPHLEEGMVVTVEPGIYFSAYALSYFYLPSPIHSKYINKEVLYRYFPVGGVRIEDDILITSKGYENLTTAPKGQAMLEIIRSQNARWPFVSEISDFEHTRTSTVERKEEVEEPLLRAPGIPKRASEAAIKPVSRAATAPAESFNIKNPNVPRAVPSFARHPPPQVPLELRTPICGVSSPGFSHLHLAWDMNRSKDMAAIFDQEVRPPCNKCILLSMSLHRMKQLDPHNTFKRLERASTLFTQPRPAAARYIPEMQQVGGSPCLMGSGGPDRASAPEKTEPLVRSEHSTTGPFSDPKNSSTVRSQLEIEQTNRSQRNANGIPFPTSTTGPNVATPKPQPEVVASQTPHLRTSVQQTSLRQPPRPQPAALENDTRQRERERQSRPQQGPSLRASLPTLRSQPSDIPATFSPVAYRYSGGVLVDSPGVPFAYDMLSELQVSRPTNNSSAAVPLRQKSVKFLPQGTQLPPITSAAPAGAPNGVAQPNRTQEAAFQGQKLEDLRMAMEQLWRRQEDVEQRFRRTGISAQPREDAMRE